VVLGHVVEVELVVVELVCWRRRGWFDVELLVVELVVVVTQPPASQASQQLDTLPAHPPVARQARAAELLMCSGAGRAGCGSRWSHRDGPHVDRREQRSADRSHSCGKRRLTDARA
jgi:hypothetical protein